jgi:hypothetical protein
MDGRDIEGVIFRATGSVHPLDVAFITEEDQAEPWKSPPALSKLLGGPMPASLTLTLANQLYFEKAQLPQSLLNRLIRLAAFQNPEFYRAQVRGFSVWDKPRIIGRAENCPRHIALPRGCLDDVMKLLRDNNIACEIRDERVARAKLSRCHSLASCVSISRRRWPTCCGRTPASCMRQLHSARP